MVDSGKLIKVIKRIVKEEIKLQFNSLLKEKIEENLNKILAERFIQTLSENKNSKPKFLNVSDSEEKSEKVKRQQLSEERRASLLRKMGVQDDPLAAGIFEDVEISGGGTIISSSGIVSEDDDEGIDISQFGLRKVK